MLNHQNRFAHVKDGSAARAASQIFGAVHERFDCFQNRTSASSREYQPLPTMPWAVRARAGEVVGLRRSTSPRGTPDWIRAIAPLAGPARERAASMLPSRPRRQADDVEDDGLVHGDAGPCAGAASGVDGKLSSTHSYSRPIESSRSSFSPAGSTSHV